MKPSIFDELMSIGAPRAVELYARLTILERSPIKVERTRDTIHLFYENGNSLLFTPEGFEVRIEGADWVTTSETMPTSRLVSRHTFHDLLKQKKLQPKHIIDLIQEADEFRKRDNKECKYCKKSYPHERRFSDDVCYGCARIHLGVIF